MSVYIKLESAIHNWKNFEGHRTELGKTVFAFHNDKTGWAFRQIAPSSRGCCNQLRLSLFRLIRWLHLGYGDSRLTQAQKNQLKIIVTTSKEVLLGKNPKPAPQVHSTPSEVQQDRKEEVAKADAITRCDTVEEACAQVRAQFEKSKASYAIQWTLNYVENVIRSHYYPSWVGGDLEILKACVARLPLDAIKARLGNIQYQLYLSAGPYAGILGIFDHIKTWTTFCLYSPVYSDGGLFAIACYGDVEALSRYAKDPYIVLKPETYDRVTPFDVALHFGHIPFLEAYLKLFKARYGTNITCGRTLFRQSNFPLLALVRDVQTLKWLLNSGIALNFHGVASERFGAKAQTILEIYINTYRSMTKEEDFASNEHFEMIELLVKRDPTVILARNSDREDLLEHYYFQLVSKYSKINRRIFAFLMENYPGKVSNRILTDIQERALLNNDLRFLEFLPLQRRQEIELTLKNRPAELSFASLQARCHAMTLILNRELRRWNLVPERISLTATFQALCLKRDIKDFLRSHDISSPEGVLFSSDYNSFLEAYKTVRQRQPFLRTICNLDRLVRKNAQVPMDLFKMRKVLSLLDYTYSELHAQKDITVLWRQEAVRVRLRLGKAHKELSDLLPNWRNMVLAHGTRFVSVMSAFKLNNVIMASGELIKHGIAPLTGEGSSEAVSGHNLTGISTIVTDTDFRQPTPGIGFNAYTRLGTAKQYATQETDHGDTVVRKLVYRPENAMQDLTDSIEWVGRNGWNENRKWQLKRSIMRFRQTDSQFREKTQDQYARVVKLAEGDSDLQECLKLWKESPPMMLQCEHLFPVILAATDYRMELAPKGAVSAHMVDERAIHHPLKLGGHIQLFGVGEEDLKIACSEVSRAKIRNVRVLTFGAMQLLEMRTLIQNDQERSYTLSNKDREALLSHARLKSETQAKEFPPAFLQILEKSLAETPAEGFATILSETFHKNAAGHEAEKTVLVCFENVVNEVVRHKKLARNFHRDVLPHYATPYVEDPHYLNENGETVPIPRHPFYGHGYTFKSYIEEIENGQAVARKFHGAMHSTRVVIYTLMQISLYHSKGKKVELDPYSVAMAAGWHDALRGDESTDHWDRASGFAMKDYLKQEKIPEKHVEVLFHAVAHKDSGKFETLEHEMIYNADLLEYRRVISDPSQFKREYLTFYSKPDFAAEVNPLIEEAFAFTMATESDALKLYLEQHSQDYLTDLLTIFKHMHSKKNCFPLMNRYLNEVISIICPGDPVLDPHLLQLI